LKHRTNTSYTLAAVVLIGELRDEPKRVHRRQQDDLPAHVKRNAYYKYQGPGNTDNGYYVDLSTKTHTPVEFVQANDSYFWVGLLWKPEGWFTSIKAKLQRNKNLGWWIESDPQHPEYVSPEHFSPTLHTAIEQSPEEEILAGGIHHIATLQGSHPFTEQEPILPQIESAVQQGIPIPLHTTPASAIHPQLSIRTTMAGQQEEINVATGQSEQEAQRINVIAHSSNGALKGNPPPIFNGDRSTTRKFINNFDLWKALNRQNDIIRKPFSRVITLLTYMDGPLVDAWKEEQMCKLQEAMDDGAQETDEDLWDSFMERFKNAFTNQNQKEEAYQKLCKLKQGENLDDFFTKFKQLTHEAGVPLDDKGTIEMLKHAMKPPLTRAIIHSPNFDPNVDTPWTFKKWEEQARKSHQQWLAASQFSQQKAGLYKAFGLTPKQNQGRSNQYGRNRTSGPCTTSQGGHAMDINASRMGQTHSDAKKQQLMDENKCFYCEIKGHQARVCRKKIADCAKSGKTANDNTPTVQGQGPIDMTPDDISSFLTKHMGLLDEDTKLSIIESLMPKDFPQAQN